MYRYTLHNLTHDAGDIQSPGPDWFLKTAVYAPPERLVCVWEQNYGSDDGWGESLTTTADPFLEPGFAEEHARNDPVAIAGCA